MTLQEVLASIEGFIPLKSTSQTIEYACDVRNENFKYVDVISKIVNGFPVSGSNCFIENIIRNYKSFKKFRLNLNDLESMRDEDIQYRIDFLAEAIKKIQCGNSDSEQQRSEQN